MDPQSPTAAANTLRDAAPTAAVADREICHPPASRHEAAPRFVQRAPALEPPADTAKKP